MSDSPFLRIAESEWTAHNPLAFAVRDNNPVSPGHTLVISKRAVATWFDASRQEQDALLTLVAEVKAALDQELRPDGYNVGFNAGEAAGQTVMHLHLHVIPRYQGDMDDPRGGVRHVIPSSGNYLRQVRPLSSGGESDPFAHHVLPLFSQAGKIAVVAAFVQESGLVRISPALHDALARGASIRLVTGDYLNITQASALELLLDLASAWGLDDEDEDERRSGTFEARVVEVERLPGRTRVFHPKSWLFEVGKLGVAFVGSSNLSRSALDTGIEWNLRVDSDRDRQAFARIRDAFEALWKSARPLDAAWVEAYALRARASTQALPPGELDEEPLATPEEPHRVQHEALAALRAGRAQGRGRSLVVLATGLGKTWLAAFDYTQLADELGARPRLLFLAHRRELLRQAAQTYRRLLRHRGEHARVGWFVEDESELDADLVFASVAKLSRAAHLEKLRGHRFDYVVIDEVHHAASDSYRRILAALEPRFLLGLTATPDRADAADILGLFDDHLAYRADVIAGIELGRLVPFHYFGLRDEINYANIPWKNRRWDPERLAAAAQTEQRMQTLWDGMHAHPGERTLVFCCSVAHASYVRAWLRARGVRVNAVFAAEGSDDRDETLEKLRSGELDALCAVDIFNEGVDLPALDRVIMLRPTESGVVFLQQLGRGLRAHTGKKALTVIDFVGNHRVFLERLRTLLSLAGTERQASLSSLLNSDQALELPAGCSVDVAVEAKELLQRLFRTGGADGVERVYRELRATRGRRPCAGELQRMGYPPRTLAQRHGSWFEFVRSEADLTDGEARACELALPFLRELETTEMKSSFKMVTLEAMLEAERITSGMPVREIAQQSHAILRRSPELWSDVTDGARFSELDATNEDEWLAYWEANPIAAWTSTKKERRPWFQREHGELRPKLVVPEDLNAHFSALVHEVVDYRLAQYRARASATLEVDGFVCRVLSNQRDPILKLPSRKEQQLPDGESDVRLPDGSVWQFRFMKEFVNVARPPGGLRNQLPDLLRTWFGPRAGQPGTAFQVRFYKSPDGLWVEAVNSSVAALERKRGVVVYPSLRAAAGHAQGEAEGFDSERVWLPVENDGPELFAVRVSGTSMDGGAAPLRDGDWALMRFARGASASSMLNRVVLAETSGDGSGAMYQIKRLKQYGGRWQLTSDNPDGPALEPGANVTAIARLERGIRPEDLAPAVGSLVSKSDLAHAFGIDELMADSGRYGGHLFVFVDRQGMLDAVDRVLFTAEPRRPSETAYVLAKAGESYRYLGVGRWSEDEVRWCIPEVDFATWRTWGAGRDVSRALPEGVLVRAQLAVDVLLSLPNGERSFEQAGGRAARVLGRAQRGGLRIDGGKGGFGERTVSLNDLAWVIVADDDTREHGGLLDEERVNRLRYLEGTPKGSTRWIDTQWAIAAWEKARGLMPTSEISEVLKVQRDDETLVDATFRVQRVGAELSVVFEARGGTAGSANARNTQYGEGLELVLHRLKAAGAQLVDAFVESGDTMELPVAERRIALGQRSYPISIGDSAELAQQLGAGQAKVGRAAGAKGRGNRTRRIRLVLGLVDDSESVSALGRRIAEAESAAMGSEHRS